MTARALQTTPPVDDTVGWYDRTAAAYAADTLARNPLKLQAAFLARLPKGGTILDAGSRSGRDTLFLTQSGSSHCLLCEPPDCRGDPGPRRRGRVFGNG